MLLSWKKVTIFLIITILGTVFYFNKNSYQNLNYRITYKIDFNGSEIEGSGVYTAEIWNNDHPIIRGDAISIELADGRILFFAVTASRPLIVAGKTRSREMNKFFMHAFSAYYDEYILNYEEMLKEFPSILLDPAILPKVYLSVPPHLPENLVETPHENLSSHGIRVKEFRLNVTNDAKTTGHIMGFLPWLEDPEADRRLRFDLTLSSDIK